MHSCFFCQQPLVPFKDEKRTGNYPRHRTCYKCGDTNSWMDSIEVRKRPYVISMEKDTIVTASLFFKKNKIWLETFYFEERPFSDIREDDWIHILRVHHSIDLTKYTPETLESKIKTWVTFY